MAEGVFVYMKNIQFHTWRRRPLSHNVPHIVVRARSPIRSIFLTNILGLFRNAFETTIRQFFPSVFLLLKSSTLSTKKQRLLYIKKPNYIEFYIRNNLTITVPSRTIIPDLISV